MSHRFNVASEKTGLRSNVRRSPVLTRSLPLPRPPVHRTHWKQYQLDGVAVPILGEHGQARKAHDHGQKRRNWPAEPQRPDRRSIILGGQVPLHLHLVGAVHGHVCHRAAQRQRPPRVPDGRVYLKAVVRQSVAVVSVIWEWGAGWNHRCEKGNQGPVRNPKTLNGMIESHPEIVQIHTRLRVSPEWFLERFLTRPTLGAVSVVDTIMNNRNRSITGIESYTLYVADE